RLPTSMRRLSDRTRERHDGSAVSVRRSRAQAWSVLVVWECQLRHRECLARRLLTFLGNIRVRPMLAGRMEEVDAYNDRGRKIRQPRRGAQTFNEPEPGKDLG